MAVSTSIATTAATNGTVQTKANSGSGKSWMAAMAEAWGATLDKKAAEISAVSAKISASTNDSASVNNGTSTTGTAAKPAATTTGTAAAGTDSKNGSDPSTLVTMNLLTQEMTYLSSATQTTMSTAGEASNTLARKG